jgi:hypothetical protein
MELLHMNMLTTLKNYIKLYPKWFIIGVSFFVFLPVFNLNFWLIDDHEIVKLLSAFYSGGWNAFWYQWLQFEDFSEVHTRFRPIYYFIRAIEVLIWQDATYLWAFTRLLIVIIFCISLYTLAIRIFPVQIALLISLSFFCMPWLPDTFFRLGPSEAYAYLFVAILNFSFFIRNQSIRWLSISFSIMMLIGIKENFIILLPIAFLGVYQLLKQRKFIHSLLALCFVMLSLLIIAILVLKLYLSSGMDVYNNSVGNDRLTSAINSLFFSKYGWITIFLVTVSTFLYVQVMRLENKVSKIGLIIFLSAIVILFFNLYFYGGVTSIRMRYAFPFWMILIYMPALLLLLILKSHHYNKWIIDKYLGVRTFRVLTILFFIVLAVLFVKNIYKGYSYAKLTTSSHQEVLKIVEKSKLFDMIVIHVNDPRDYEPVTALPVFLKFYKVSKPIFLKTDNFSANKLTLSEKLWNKMQQIEVSGGNGYLPKHTSNEYTKCLEIVFNNDISTSCNLSILVSVYP